MAAHKFRRLWANLEPSRCCAAKVECRRDLDWRDSSGLPGAGTEGAKSRLVLVAVAETWPGNRAYSDGSDPRIFKTHTRLAFLNKCDGGF